MAWFSKKPDPITNRARALNDEISHLEAEIKRLDSQLKKQPAPRLRSTAAPHGPTVGRTGVAPAEAARLPAPSDPVFEAVDRNRLTAAGAAADTPDHYNDLGVRKYDLPALLQRLRQQFRGPSTTNPKLVSYLAAGGIQGLRPLRYEKRLRRRQLLVLVAFLFLVVLGLFAAFIKHNR